MLRRFAPYSTLALALWLALVTSCGQESSPKAKNQPRAAQADDEGDGADDDGDKSSDAQAKTKPPQGSTNGDDFAGDASDDDGSGDKDDAEAGDDAKVDAKASKERVVFQAARNVKAPGFIYWPAGVKGGTKKRGAVLLMYGLGGDKDSSQLTQFAEVLNAQGLIAFTFDVAGRGERAGQASAKGIDIVQNKDLFRWYLEDYGAALTYLSSLKEVDGNKLAYAGASWGAITGVPFAANDKRVKVMISVVGGGGFGVGGITVVPADLDPAKTVARIAPRPLWLINATNDQVILKPFAEALHNAAPAGAKKTWLNTDHTLTGIDLKGLAGQVAQFIKQGIGG